MKAKDSTSQSRRQNRLPSLRLDELCPHCSKQHHCILPPLAGSPLSIEMHTYQAKEYVVRQGEPRSSLPLVCCGLIMVTALTDVGDEMALQGYGVGEFIGLTDWLQGEEIYSISGRALIETTVGFIRPQDLLRHVQTNPKLLTTLLRQIGFQIRTLEHRVHLQTVQDASDRVIYVLLKLARQLAIPGEKDVALPTGLSRMVIAEFAGIRRETVSRVLAHLKKNRLIVESNRHITIPCLSRLQTASRHAPGSS